LRFRPWQVTNSPPDESAVVDLPNIKEIAVAEQKPKPYILNAPVHDEI
jgi:hypothetical protein